MNKYSKLYIDTREQGFREIIRRIAKVVGFTDIEEKALPFGDIESDNCIVERKTIDDLISSIVDKENKRYFTQLGKGLTTKKEFMLLITGIIEENKEDIITGIIASTIKNYPNYKVLYIEDPFIAVWAALKWMKKVEENPIPIPHNLPCEVVISKIFNVSLPISKQLKKKYKNLNSIIDVILTEPEKLEKDIKGLGKKKIESMKKNLYEWKKVY